jgi:hypothetical protein
LRGVYPSLLLPSQVLEANIVGLDNEEKALVFAFGKRPLLLTTRVATTIITRRVIAVFVLLMLQSAILAMPI